jgi:hypothetical protein
MLYNEAPGAQSADPQMQEALMRRMPRPSFPARGKAEGYQAGGGYDGSGISAGMFQVGDGIRPQFPMQPDMVKRPVGLQVSDGLRPVLKPGFDGGHMPPMYKQDPYEAGQGAPMGQPMLDRGGMGGGIKNLMRMLQRRRAMGDGGGVPAMSRPVPEVNPMDDMGDGSENSLQKLLALRRNSMMRF